MARVGARPSRNNIIMVRGFQRDLYRLTLCTLLTFISVRQFKKMYNDYDTTSFKDRPVTLNTVLNKFYSFESNSNVIVFYIVQSS